MLRLRSFQPTPAAVSRAIKLAAPVLFLTALAACNSDDRIAAPATPGAAKPAAHASSLFAISAPYYSSDTRVIDDNGTPAASSIVYIALPEGALPDARTFSLQGAHGGAVTAVAMNGGMDPIAVVAGRGDVVTATVYLASGESAEYTLSVPDVGQPVVVRVSPPANMDGVALTASMEVEFSEPIGDATLAANGVQLLNGASGDGSAVVGRLDFNDTGHLRLSFTPYAPLDPGTTYQLQIGSGVQDANGQALNSAVTIQFTTITTLH